MIQFSNKIFLLFALQILLIFCAQSYTFTQKEIILHGMVPHTLTIENILKEYRKHQRILGLSPDTTHQNLHIFFTDASHDPQLTMMLPEWGSGGLLSPDTILIRLDKTSFWAPEMKQTISHELVHCLLYRHFPHIRIPRWFHEGCAMVLSSEISHNNQYRLALGVLTSSLLSFEQIESVNSYSQLQAQLAYAQCQATLTFIIESYSIKSLQAITEQLKHAPDFESALADGLGLSSIELQNHAQKWIAKKYGFIFLFIDLAPIWLTIFILFIIAYIITRIRNRKKRKRMEEEEQRDESYIENGLDLQ